jgi:GNAT superfamily N-acetyltransferase
MDISEIIIIPKPENITWEEITDLLHKGYAEHLKNGILYSAAVQDVSKTIERLEEGTCMVVLYKGKLIATETYVLKRRKHSLIHKWYYDNSYFYLHSLTVHPDYKRRGIGSMLRNRIVEIAKETGVDSIISDTSIKAKWLISWYDRLGHKKVGLVSHKGTNYYSVVMKTPLKNKNVPDWYRLIRYGISYLICKTLYKENGDFRFYPEILERIKLANIKQ